MLALGQGIDGPAPAAYAADIAPEETRGLAMGLYRTSGDFGFVVGPPLLGLIADHNSFGWALGVNAVLVALSVLVFAALAREMAGRASTAARTVEAVDL